MRMRKPYASPPESSRGQDVPLSPRRPRFNSWIGHMMAGRLGDARRAMQLHRAGCLAYARHVDARAQGARAHTHRHTQTHAQTHTDTHSHTRRHADTQTHIHTDTHTHTNTRAREHTHTRTNTITHTHTSTRAPTRARHARAVTDAGLGRKSRSETGFTRRNGPRTIRARCALVSLAMSERRRPRSAHYDSHGRASDGRRFVSGLRCVRPVPDPAPVRTSKVRTNFLRAPGVKGRRV